MTPDYPPGEWSALLVGLQWVSQDTVTILDNAIAKRKSVVANYTSLHDMLQNAINTTLAQQEGATADAIRDAFREGADQAFNVAEKNEAYEKALQQAHNNAVLLRGILTGIADRGNAKIKEILDSEKDYEIKVAEISEEIAECQRDANQAAAACSDNIMDAGEEVLAAQGKGQSFRGLAHNAGLGGKQQPDLNAIKDQVRGQLDQKPGTPGSDPFPDGNAADGDGALAPKDMPDSTELSNAGNDGGALAPGGPAGSTAEGAAPTSAGPTGSMTGGGTGASGAPAPSAAASSPTAGPGASGVVAAPAPPAGAPPTGPAPGAPVSAGLAPTGSAPGPGTRGVVAAPTGAVGPQPGITMPGPGTSGVVGASPPPAPPLSGTPAGGGGSMGGLGGSAGGLPMQPGSFAPPSSMANVAPPGLAASSPVTAMPGAGNPLNTSGSPSASTPGLGGGPVQSMASEMSPSQPTAPTFPAAAGTPITVGDAPPPAQQAPTPAPPVPTTPTPATYTSEPAAPMMTGPAASPVLGPSAPSGPLPAYGSDLRPPAAAAAPTAPTAPITPSAPTPVNQPTAAPTASAPVHPSAGGPSPSQPTAMVRQPGPPTSPQSPSGVGSQSVIAATGGALAGAVSADATARTRLQRLLAAVARQQPGLAWAIGDGPDDTTVLVTDVADGWIPPGIEIPSAVTLLEPARRRGDLEALLGEVKLAVTFAPGHYRPDPGDEAVPTSTRVRRAPDVDELGWQLSQATHWRDGLPMLAHTLAKAASRGTGVLESEAELLHGELVKIAARVLKSYPEDVDEAAVGNWQLLAAIEALVTGERAVANYHLAWFLACNTATTADGSRL